MNRIELLTRLKEIGVNPKTYGEQTIAIDTFKAIKEKQLCDSCRYDYCGCSVQDSILQIDPKANFKTFGCNSFKPCK
jgi:hypothetical protein